MMRGRTCGTLGQVLIVLAMIAIFNGKASAETYYVATNGNDDNAGTIDLPWATFQKAIYTAVAGDTVYFRGGTYPMNTQIHYTPPSIGNNGTEGNPICYFNYPGESPVFDWASYSESGWFNAGMGMEDCNEIHFKGLEFKNIFQTRNGVRTSGVFAQAIQALRSYNLTFENMVIHNIGGRAFNLQSGLDQHPEIDHDTTRFINCDLYDLCDSLCVSTNAEVCATSSVGGTADGIKVDCYTGQYLIIDGCRIWHFSDNGIDVSNSVNTVISNCWVFRGGDFNFTDIDGAYAGEGSGIKYGNLNTDVSTTVRVVKNCISAYNRTLGFDESNSYSFFSMLNCEVYNNTSYKNQIGFGNFSYSVDNDPVPLNKYKNNISYQDDVYQRGCELNCPLVEEYNSWISGDCGRPVAGRIPITDSDFISLDSTELYRARQADGSMPDINFLKLAPGSNLIDNGTDVGLPFSGVTSDLGYSEHFIPPIPVTGIAVTGAGGSTTINTDNGTLQLTATITPSNATYQEVVWSISTGTDRATISSTGLITAVSDGYVTARATATDGSGVYGQLQITISNQVVPVTGITVTGAGGVSTINSEDGTLQLSATVTPGNATNQSVTWSLQNGTGQATISSIGLINAESAGTVTAMATANDGSGVSGTLIINIFSEFIPVSSISVTGAGGATTISTDNGTLQLSATVLPANASIKTVTWSVANGSGEATISGTGLVTAVADGIITARATATDGSLVVGSLDIYISNQDVPLENHPPEISDQYFDVYESDPQEDFIGTILAYDSDFGQILHFSIEAGNENDLFRIEESSGNLYFASVPVDFYSINQFELQVSVRDNGEGELSDMAQILINLIPSADVYYIDPENSQDEVMDGSINHPFDSWEKVDWEDGAVYFQKRGTSSVEENTIEITKNNVTIGAYGSGDNPEIVSLTDEYAIQASNKANISIQNMIVKAENALSCLYFVGEASDNITVEYCTFESQEYGVRIINGGAFYISKNNFRNAINAIFLIADFAEIDYNNFSSNQQAINLKTSTGDARIFNNVFCDNAKGIVADEAQTLIYNNIFYFTSTSDCAIEHTLTNCYSDYNIFYPEQSGFVRLSGTSYSSIEELNQLTTLDAFSLVKDPLLKDRFQYNFEILNGSPAIDAGIYIGPLEDIYGTKVPIGKAPDIGSFEKKIVLSDRSDGIITNEQEDGILVYPNPTRDNLNIKNQRPNSSFSYIEILDYSGRVLLQKELDAFSSGSIIQLQLTDLFSGIYWLRIYSDNGNPVIKKFLIK